MLVARVCAGSSDLVSVRAGGALFLPGDLRQTKVSVLIRKPLMDKKHLVVELQPKVNGYPESNIPPINGLAKTRLNQIRLNGSVCGQAWII